MMGFDICSNVNKTASRQEMRTFVCAQCHVEYYFKGMELISDIKKASEKNENSTALPQAREYQRKAQFLLDFVEAENSGGFHAPQEAARILHLSLDYIRKGQVSLLKK